MLISTNITSPLGLTTEDNYRALAAGRSALSLHAAGTRGVPFPFEAALLTEEQWAAIEEEARQYLPHPTRFEALVMHSVTDALRRCSIDVTHERTLLILSTTKGDLLTPPGTTARRVATALRMTTEPVVVCNACISGVAAQLLALRMLETHLYDTAIVVGADVQTAFIISGFHCLKALSDEPCRPFDAERLGLNLGEAAATMIYSRHYSADNAWYLHAGAIANDAYHISGPHPKGEGCLRALRQAMGAKERLAVIGVHGTATMYNDQMESKAIERAALGDIPLSALKGYYGHTMGAAGLLETIVTARALDDGIILPSRGYHECGVSGRIYIAPTTLTTTKREFIKLLSGFGGCNGAIRLSKEHHASGSMTLPTLRTVATVSLSGLSSEALNTIYKEEIGGYPKYYKMDMLSRLAFVATERLLRQTGDAAAYDDGETAVILFNRTSSVVADRAFAATIAREEAYYPSPALFVHTLPNISTGETALRHAWHGETSFYILPHRDERMMDDILRATLALSPTRRIVTGWVDCEDMDHMECEMRIVTGA